MTAAEHEEFENGGTAGEPEPWPEVGSRMMTRVLTGQDMRDGWVIVQDGVYRFRVQQCGVMLVRTVLFEYLATEVQWSRPLDTGKARCGPLLIRLRLTDLAGMSPSMAGTRRAFSAVCRHQVGGLDPPPPHSVPVTRDPVVVHQSATSFRGVLRRVKRNRAADTALSTGS